MKPSLYLPILAVATAAAFIAGRWSTPSHTHPTGTAEAPTTRRVRFYQSPMHPWITSPAPGNCTLCGMKLVPVYEGESGIATESDILQLAPNSISAVGIASATVDTRPLTLTLRVAGTVDDDDSRHRILSAPVEGRIESIALHHPGAEAHEGRELATLYSPALLSAAREYVALARNGTASNLLAAASVRLRQMGLAESQIVSLPSSFAPDQRTLPLPSPVSGTVTRRLVYAGQWVREGDPLFEIADFNTMWFKFDAYERDLAWIRTGQEIIVSTPSLPGKYFTNRIAFIDPNLDPVTRTTQVRVELPNPAAPGGRPFRNKLFAEGHVKQVSAPVLAVPRSAVLNPGGTPSVWIELAPGTYRNRPVRLGRAGDDAYEVLDGVQAGERVVIHGGLLLDAQSQLRNGGSSTPASAPVSSNTPPSAVAWRPSDPIAERAVAAFLRATALAGRALADDNLADFNAARAAITSTLEQLRRIAPNPPPEAWLHSPPEAAALPVARKSFLELLAPWIPVAEALRTHDGFKDLHLFKCPMTSRSFPGAPATAVWWQWERPVRNPWFGKDMLDCGTELP